MPPKNAKGNAAKKEQIAEKVKEIQMRQKNWLRQRDDHLKKSESSSTPVSDRGYTLKTVPKDANPAVSSRPAPPPIADILQVHHDTSQDLSSQVSDKLNVKVKHNFGAWLQSRSQVTNDTQNGPSGEVEHIKGHDSRFAVEEHSYVPTPNSVSSVRSSNRSYPLSPAEFNSLADNIASRVKKDLGIVNGTRNSERREESLNRGRTFLQSDPEVVHVSNKFDRGDQRYKHARTNGEDGGDNAENGEVDVSNHRCPFCSSLMADAQHVPTLLVPCGHTVCKVCAVSHSACRMCGLRVASLTTNIMLQQIIQEFHHKTGRHKGLLPSHPSPSESLWERQIAGTGGPAKSTALQRDVNYSTQLRSLLERQATLEEEASSCRRERDSITSKVRRAEKQLSGIEREECGLKEQLKQLEEKLDSLRHHKKEYAGDLAHLQEEQKLASDQVTLVERTLKSLGEEIDKVQFLAEGQNDLLSKKRIQQR